MKVQLDAEKTVVVAPAVTKNLNEVTIARIVDLPLEKKVRVFVRELGRPVDLPQLSGDNYGDWSDEDVVAALKDQISSL